MDLVVWRSTPDHTLAAVFRELAKNHNLRLTVACYEDIKEHRKRSGWRLPDFGNARLEILPENGWTGRIDQIIRDNAKAIHIIGAFLRFAKMRYVIRKILKNKLTYGVMSENPVNQGTGFAWILKEIYLRTVTRYTLPWIARQSLFLLTICSQRESLRVFPQLGWPQEKLFPFGYFVEAPMSTNDGEGIKTPDMIELAYVGMLIKRKGVDLLIKALSQVKQRGVEFRCNIIGNGIYRQELESLAQALNLQNEVIFRGALPNAEVRTLLNSCDILVAPGNLEPWGVPVNEAIQSGLPVVVSDSVLGGSDLVRASGAGQVFAAGNVDSLAASLLKLMSDPAALPQAKEKARTYAWRISPEVAAEYLRNVILYSLGEISERPAAPWLQCEE
jgi:glycosyltransferase involved in cell wall biosynthesis